MDNCRMHSGDVILRLVHPVRRLLYDSQPLSFPHHARVFRSIVHTTLCTKAWVGCVCVAIFENNLVGDLYLNDLLLLLR